MRCLFKGCPDDAKTRGLCGPHRQRIPKAIGQEEFERLYPVKIRKRRPGERWLDKNGYVNICMPDGRVTPEHREVMRQHIGRDFVRGENVHHINGDRTDNRLTNLELWYSAQPQGQRVENLIDYIATYHREAVLARV